MYIFIPFHFPSRLDSGVNFLEANSDRTFGKRKSSVVLAISMDVAFNFLDSVVLELVSNYPKWRPK